MEVCLEEEAADGAEKYTCWHSDPSAQTCDKWHLLAAGTESEEALASDAGISAGSQGWVGGKNHDLLSASAALSAEEEEEKPKTSGASEPPESRKSWNL